MFIRAYLRASTDEQDANRAKDQLRAFAAERGLTVAAWYTENESGAQLARPELFRLLNDACPGDVLLVEESDLRAVSPDFCGLGAIESRADRAACSGCGSRLADIVVDGDQHRR